MLGDLAITQRIGLLVTLPVAAVLLTGVPFVVERVDQARDAAAVAAATQEATEVGALVQRLQQERLLQLAHLATPNVDTAALVAAAVAVDDLAAVPVARQLSSKFELLHTLRADVAEGHADADRVQALYRGLIDGLIDTLALSGRTDTDAAGQRLLDALDALLRGNEQAARFGAAMVASATTPLSAQRQARDAQAMQTFYVEAFRIRAEPDDVALLDVIASGPSSLSYAALAGRLTAPDPAQISPVEALAAAQTSITLRQVFQDRVARDLQDRADREARSAVTAAAVGAGFTVSLLAGLIWLGTVVGRSVSRPLARLTAAATAVADIAAGELRRAADADAVDDAPPELAAVNVRTRDELGELASAFNRVQATAALMMQQQVNSRRNVSVMFANIARRTRGLAARQLSQIDALERDERDELRLAALYRLDHIATRLRRSADSLLVISGSRDEARMGSAAPLSDVIRSATAEIEGYQKVKVAAVTPLTVLATLVPDLTLLLAELLDNATSFSPDNAPVTVSVDWSDSCRISITDQGIGMSEQRLAEENRRLLESERLDVAPTTMLGLFVVGRLARRHGLSVVLRPGSATGLTAEVVVPPRYLSLASAPVTAPVPAPLPADVPAGSQHRTNHARTWDWFDPPAPATQPEPEQPSAVNRMPAPAARHADAAADVMPETRGGLRRRQRVPEESPAPLSEPAHALRDPERERAGLTAFMQGAQRADVSRDEPRPSAESRHGLVRRVPGAQLPAEMRSAVRPVTAAPAPPPTGSLRDPDAERDALAAFLAGHARATGPDNPYHRSAP
ncbi:sensor histidine kinase [Catellatospora citrea]|uniref:histidine kinase n=1 Tax=Catellatospora citrea TaxID=53366 RepID=A0A8J3KM35_9ACTN|nr:nitrate- and nitrite sensing domain-containing protein [Catellatospora citrea]RKE10682.1 signal transduction histidine kinase [Catellatospora citrea]GIG01184.1 histidine kinase [Catellatospora citrea]